MNGAAPNEAGELGPEIHQVLLAVGLARKAEDVTL
jgi:hypothetical protein